MDYVIAKFPFRISTVRTDRGHEFQVRFHCYVEDQGIQHVYIKPRTPRLNGKVERSHRTDQAEFYQLLAYTDDVDLNSKLKGWEDFYNYDRPHISHGRKTTYEVRIGFGRPANILYPGCYTPDSSSGPAGCVFLAQDQE
jgi:transposase InsO family protein